MNSFYVSSDYWPVSIRNPQVVNYNSDIAITNKNNFIKRFTIRNTNFSIADVKLWRIYSMEWLDVHSNSWHLNFNWSLNCIIIAFSEKNLPKKTINLKFELFIIKVIHVFRLHQQILHPLQSIIKCGVCERKQMVIFSKTTIIFHLGGAIWLTILYNILSQCVQMYMIFTEFMLRL